MGKISFFFGEAFGSLWRNYFMTIAAVVTVLLSMVVLGVVMVFAWSINGMLKDDLSSKVEITVFLKDTATADAIESHADPDLSWPEVKDAQFVSKEKALERLREDLKDHPEILDTSPRNPLPASFEISLKDPEQVDVVATRFEGNPIVDEVKYGKEIAERIFSVTSAIRNVMLVFLILLLGAVSVLLISNTIRLSIFARRREVEIMKLVGATNWFIRWPFVIEGVTVGCWEPVWRWPWCLIGTDFVVRQDPPESGLPECTFRRFCHPGSWLVCCCWRGRSSAPWAPAWD